MTFGRKYKKGGVIWYAQMQVRLDHDKNGFHQDHVSQIIAGFERKIRPFRRHRLIPRSQIDRNGPKNCCCSSLGSKDITYCRSGTNWPVVRCACKNGHLIAFPHMMCRYFQFIFRVEDAPVPGPSDASGSMFENNVSGEKCGKECSFSHHVLRANKSHQWVMSLFSFEKTKFEVIGNHC